MLFRPTPVNGRCLQYCLTSLSPYPYIQTNPVPEIITSACGIGPWHSPDQLAFINPVSYSHRDITYSSGMLSLLITVAYLKLVRVGARKLESGVMHNTQEYRLMWRTIKHTFVLALQAVNAINAKVL